MTARRIIAWFPGGIFAHKAMQIVGSRRSALDMARGRLVLMSAIFIFSYILVAARAVDLTVIQGALPYYAGEAAEDALPGGKAPVIMSLRADITDRNGVLLATSLETASLYADPPLISDAAATAQRLAAIFSGLSYGDILQKLQREGTHFIWIKRNMTPAQQMEVLRLGQPGLKFQAEYSRIYPQGNLAAHVAGYADVDGNGLAGVERSFDGLLSGDESLALTLDIRLQHIMRRELAKTVSDFNATGGAGIIMDVNNGEILAAVSLPDFDPQNPGVARPEQKFNNATLGVFEMGSTFKIFSTAALLELTGAKMGDTFDATKPLKIGRFTISDYHAQKRVLTVPEVFMHSSNIGAALMGQKVGTAALKSFYADLGLTTPAAIEVEEVGKPLVPNPWRETSTLTASFGHGIAVSPVQLVAAASSIVNGGLLVQPTFVLDKTKTKNPDQGKAASVRIVSPQTSHRMRQLLRLVVTEGTGQSADVTGYSVGGKTGTAEKSVNGRYDRGRLVSSFIGFFPIDAPRYAVFVMVDEPKGNKASFGYATGGWTAAPAAGRVISAMGPLVGIEPDNAQDKDDLAAPLKQYVTFEPDAKGGSNASLPHD